MTMMNHDNDMGHVHLHHGIGSLCLEGTGLEYVLDPRHALDGLWSPHSWSVGFGSLCLEGTGLEYVSTDTLLGITGNC